MKLRLPEAPATNRYYRNFRGRMVMSDLGRQYKRSVELLAARECRRIDDLPFPVTTPLTVSIHWHRGRRAGDLDGRFKVVLDALQGTVYVNDSQIVELNARRYDCKDDPRMEVVVEIAEWAIAIAESARPRARTARSSQPGSLRGARPVRLRVGRGTGPPTR